MKENILKKEWYILLLLLLPFAVSIYLYPSMPESVPIHFNAAGEPDNWGPRWINAFLLPVITIGLYFLMLAVPYIDPKKKIESAQRQLSAIRLIITLFMLAVYAFVMIQTLSPEMNMVSYVLMAVGLLIFAIGNYMNTVKPNYFIGVRTPWTLENEENWRKTHRFSAKVWSIGGLLMAAFGFFFAGSSISTVVIIGISIIICVIPFVYSYQLYKKQGKANEKTA
ncbi:MAG: hypothetical protein Kapaf2KO_08640 [Candidatus Kapaibacteriales bacterium]